MTPPQIQNWFINARKRYLDCLKLATGDSAESQRYKAQAEAAGFILPPNNSQNSLLALQKEPQTYLGSQARALQSQSSQTRAVLPLEVSQSNNISNALVAADSAPSENQLQKRQPNLLALFPIGQKAEKRYDDVDPSEAFVFFE